MSTFRSRLFVISGPSGAGKGTLVSLIRQIRPDLGLTISATTRSPREGEQEGVNYYFLSDKEFSQRVDNGEFVEWANVHGHKYGTLVSEVRNKLDSGSSLILEIDVQGALHVKELFSDAVLIFIAPPSLDELKRRLIGRGTESEDAVKLRLANAETELSLAQQYDVTIVNDNLDVAAQQLATTIKSYEKN